MDRARIVEMAETLERLAASANASASDAGMAGDAQMCERLHGIAAGLHQAQEMAERVAEGLPPLAPEGYAAAAQEVRHG